MEFKNENDPIVEFILKISPTMYYRMKEETESDPEKSKFYLGLLLGLARPKRTHSKRVK